jgi:small subunit ribosomal protein S9
MTDEQNNETSEEPVNETTEGSEGTAAGPVAEDDSSSSQAAGDEPSSTPPADEMSKEPVADASEAEQDEGSGAPAETSAAEPVAEEDSSTPTEGDALQESAPEHVEEPQTEEKKKDVIPGADLEPIAVAPEGRELSAEEKARLEAEEEEKARREAALAGADEPDADAASRAPAKMESGSRFLATGKRKRSIARVTLLPGDGKIEVNKRSLEEFFPRPLHQTMAVQPLVVSGYEGNVDVRVRVHGGGISGQAGAVRHGIARALTEIDPELRGDLKRRGFLTRDARVKERRKAGFKKARKKPQFSKR